jgi:hypothetical protein
LIGVIPIAGIMAIGAKALEGKRGTYRQGVVAQFIACPHILITALLSAIV